MVGMKEREERSEKNKQIAKEVVDFLKTKSLTSYDVERILEEVRDIIFETVIID